MLFRRTRWFDRPSYRLDQGDDAVVARIGTLILPQRRDVLLRYLPARARVAEIGVAQGHFSKRIVQSCEPSYLALIDAWDEQSGAVYVDDTNNVGSDFQARRYRAVKTRFERRGATTREVIRGYSTSVANRFENGSLDWVYVDANHGFEACLDDLTVWADKVKDDGFLCGHDFAHHANARDRFGVVEAVFAFIDRSGFHLLAVTNEQFPTFVLAKRRDTASVKRLFDLILTFEAHLVSLPQAMVRTFLHARLQDTKRRRASLMHFE